MKTTEQLIEIGAEYYNKCGKHLFAEQHPSKSEIMGYKHIYLLEMDGDYYGIEIYFNLDNTVGVRQHKIIGREYYSAYDFTYMNDIYPNQYSQKHFPVWEGKYRAIRQTRKVRELLKETKERIKRTFIPTTRSWTVKGVDIFEKSGV